MKDDFDIDLEKELANSIAHIVDEETAGAEVFVKSASADASHDNIPENNPDDSDLETDEYDDTDKADDGDGEEDEKSRSRKIRHMVIMIVSIVLAIAVIGVSAYFIVRFAYKSSMDNYGYYNNAGYTAWDKKDYKTAAENFEKALTYEEGK
ncbi:MAG: hypothetical protein ACI4EN_07250, partial [Butyrivibrio sp.]